MSASYYAAKVGFSSVVSLGAETFPEQYRGTGTTMILAFADLGMAITSPMLGKILDVWGFTAMLSVTSATLLSSIGLYGLLSLGHQDVDLHYGDPQRR